MDLLNHIPFGLREEDLKYVDVADVPKGRACACICPSCKIPLIARQGKIGVSLDIENYCTVSLFFEQAYL